MPPEVLKAHPTVSSTLPQTLVDSSKNFLQLPAHLPAPSGRPDGDAIVLGEIGGRASSTCLSVTSTSGIDPAPSATASAIRLVLPDRVS